MQPEIIISSYALLGVCCCFRKGKTLNRVSPTGIQPVVKQGPMLGFKCLILYLNLGFVSEVDETMKHAPRAIVKSHTALSPAAFLP